MAVRGQPLEGQDPRPSGHATESGRLRQIYEDHVTSVYRYVYSKVGNREEAEDLTSQVFVKAIRTYDHTRSPETLQSWLFQVARTTIADHWRRFYRLRVNSLDDLLEAGWEGPAEAAADPRSFQPETRARRLLERLPERYREVLSYRFLYNFSVRETAEKMQLSESNVKVLQFRALKRAAALERDLE
jgi:RNA polymerase sigma-70 factor (ECF subfamily)